MADIRAPIDREVRLAFWKVHILHHAASRPVYGLWLMDELAEHGYRVSPGTLYPLLHRMERNGWLRSRRPEDPKGRREFAITTRGRRVLDQIRRDVAELYTEVVKEANDAARSYR